jgi:hypothetical protein
MNRYTIFFSLVLLSCASIQSPSGGDKDVESPIVALDSAVLRASSKPSNILFVFNENVVIKPELIEINPLIFPKPVIKTKNKSLTIHLRADSLAKNTTYNIRFNKAISDLNEGNVGDYPVFLFSTGSTVDSSKRNLFIQNFKKKETLLLSFNSKSNTYRYVISQDSTSISGIPDSVELVMSVFQDKNNNSLFDPQEKGNIIRSAYDSVKVFLIPPNDKVLKVTKNGPIVYLCGLSKNNLYNKSYTAYKDTVMLSNISDTALFTNRFNKISAKIDSSEFYSIVSQGTRSTADTNKVILSTNFPIRSINPDSFIIIINQDTLYQPEVSIKNTNSVEIITDSIVTEAQILLGKKALSYSKDNYNKSQIIQISYIKPMVLEIENTQTDKMSVFLYNSKDKLVDYLILSKDQVEILRLPNDIYKLVYFIDSNQDHLLNHPLENNTSETVFFRKGITLLKRFSNRIKL